MRIVLVDLSQSLKTPDLHRIADAVEAQVFEDYAPFWQGGGVPVSVLSSLSEIRVDDAPVALVDESTNKEDSSVGWHSFNERPHAFVFVDSVLSSGGTISQGSNSVSVTVSHEVLEMVENPYVNGLHLLDAPAEWAEWREICDRVMGDSYVKGSVAVSNFLGPRAFRTGAGPYDFMRLLREPWEVRPGGYVDRLHLASGQITTTWGAKVPSWQRDLKARSARRFHRLASRRA